MLELRELVKHYPMGDGEPVRAVDGVSMTVTAGEFVAEVLELLRDLCHERQMALLLATHDPQAAYFADQVHELRDGRLTEYRPDHVLAAPVGSPPEGV